MIDKAEGQPDPEKESSLLDVTSEYRAGAGSFMEFLNRKKGQNFVLRIFVTEFNPVVLKKFKYDELRGQRKIIMRGTQTQRQEFDRKFSDYANIVEWDIGEIG